MEKNQDLWFGKTSPEHSQATVAKISGASSRKSAKLHTKAVMFLDLRKEGGAETEPSWETDSVLHGVCLTLNTGESPSAAVESTLSQILEETPLQKYYLSERACLGILRRAKEHGKELPQRLRLALMRQGGAIVLDYHPQDSRIRYSADGNVQTLTGNMGAGGNNVPLIMDTMGERTAYAMQSFEGIYKESDKASTIKERDYKDATDLILEADTKVRRLTPLECGRLQGFPDGWADRTKNQLPNSEEVEFWVDAWKDHWNLVDSKRNIKLPKTEKRVGNWLARELTDAELYKMWGNSLALPCALYVFEGIKAYENILRNNKL